MIGNHAVDALATQSLATSSTMNSQIIGQSLVSTPTTSSTVIGAPSIPNDASMLGNDGKKSDLVTLPQHTLRYPKNPYFVGREKIMNKIESRLLPADSPSNTGLAAFAIWGAPGQGKTQTAVQFAFKHRAKYQSILWAFADREQKLLESFSEHAVALGLVDATADLTDGAKALIRWFETTGMSL